jgi:hypothetical protein
LTIVANFEVAAARGTNSPIAIVLVLGLAKLVAGAISMGVRILPKFRNHLKVGDMLSTDAEVDMAKRERKREEWEVDNYIQGESKPTYKLYLML